MHRCSAAPRLNRSRRTSATTAGGGDRPGARMSRCTPTGLSHAADAVDQGKLRQQVRDHGAGDLSLVS